MCEIGGVGTDIILVHLNPHSCKTHLKGIRESGDVALVNQDREHFQDNAKLPGKRELRTVPRIRNLASFAKAKVLKEGMLAWKEIVA